MAWCQYLTTVLGWSSLSRSRISLSTLSSCLPPVGIPWGLISFALINPKSCSIAAAEYEYGADTSRGKSSFSNCFRESSEIWYLYWYEVIHYWSEINAEQKSTFVQSNQTTVWLKLNTIKTYLAPSIWNAVVYRQSGSSLSNFLHSCYKNRPSTLLSVFDWVNA